MRTGRRKLNSAFGLWIRARREQSGKSHFLYAIGLGISSAYLGQIEQGFIPPEPRIRQMAQEAGEDPDLWVAASQSDDPDSLETAAGKKEPRQGKRTREQIIRSAFEKVRADSGYNFGARGSELDAEVQKDIIRLYEQARKVKLLPEGFY